MNEKGPSGPLAPDPGPDRFDDIHIDDAWVGEDRTDPPGPLDRLRSLVLSPAGILCLVLLGASVLSGLWYLTASREKERPELSLDAYVSLTAEGYDGYARAAADLDEETFLADLESAWKKTLFFGSAGPDREALERVLSALTLETDPSEGIHNGDTVTLTIGIDQAALEDCPVLLKASSVSIQAEGLPEALSYDPFDDLGLFFEGLSGQGTLTLLASSPYPVVYQADRTSGLSNGDTVLVTAEPEGSYDADSLLSDYGIILSRDSVSLPVEGLSFYAASLADLEGQGTQAMEAEILEAVRADVESAYSETETLEGLSLAGRILLTSRYEAASPVNMVFYVYEVRYRNEEGTSAGYYYYGLVSDVLIQGDGSVTRGSEEILFPQSQHGVMGLLDSGAVYRIDFFHAVTGYENPGALFQDAVRPYETSYDVLTDLTDY